MTVQAKIIADSINANNVRITTFELIYPRIIHSELMTHRMFSRNAASSRAIPVSTMIDLIEQNPAMPSHWGKNQPGMQAKEELDEQNKQAVKDLWLSASKQAVSHARVMADIGAHKQVINRITEPYQHMKVVLTATEYNNWYWLRDHADADPTIAELAAKMKEAHELSDPDWLEEGAWHLPYVRTEKANGTYPQRYWDNLDQPITLEQALMISSSCCAQVSYRKSDGSLEKSEVVFKRLIESKPCHASPTEHQAMCIDTSEIRDCSTSWPKGITHLDSNGKFWSGNLKEWVQHRQLLADNVKLG
jgi:hypothetical protein